MKIRTMCILLMFLMATMMLVPACSPAQYILNTSASPSGSGTVTPAGGTYDDGTEVILTANPASGYIFDHWSGDATGTTSSVAIVMDSAKSTTAHFKPSLGAVVRGDVWQVKVVSVRKVTTLRGIMKSWSAKESFSFLIVEVQITNISTKEQEYDSRSIFLIDSDKLLYLPEGTEIAGDYFYDLDVAYWKITLPPGKTSPTSYIVFIVPIGAKGFHFKFQDLPAIDLGQ